MEYDLIIVGAGPAGLSAALNAAYFKLRSVIIESGSAGGAIMMNYPWKVVDNCLGFKNMTGMRVTQKMVEHVKAEGLEIKENETVTDIRREGNIIKVITTLGEYSAKSVILAIGLGVPRRLGICNENIEGAICTLSDPTKYKGKKATVVGGGDTAVESAIALQKNGAHTTIVHRRDAFRASEKNVSDLKSSGVKIIFNSEVKEIIGKDRVGKVKLINNQTNEESVVDTDVILFSLGTIPNTEFLKKIGININEKNQIIVDGNQRTNIEGIFAAGDVVGKWLRIPEAVGEGAFAALNAYKYIKNPYWA